jgi:WD repeat-containing protein 61
MHQAYSISVSPDSEILATGAQNNKVNLFSVADGESVLTIDLAPGAAETSSSDRAGTGKNVVMNSCFSADGNALAAARADGHVTLYDLQKQAISNAEAKQAHKLPCRSVCFSKDEGSNLLYSSSDDRHVAVFDRRSNRYVNHFSHNGLALSVDTSPAGRHFVVGCSDNTVTLWDIGMQRSLQTYSTHSDQVWNVRYDPNVPAGDSFVSTGDDAMIQLYGGSSDGQ